MDTRKLVVGQWVYLVSGVYGPKAGKVVKVTPLEVIVQLARFEGPVRPEGPELIRFDANGKACDSRDIYKGNMEWNGIPGTLEGGPWELIDDLQSLEEEAAKIRRTYETARKRRHGPWELSLSR